MDRQLKWCLRLVFVSIWAKANEGKYFLTVRDSDLLLTVNVWISKHINQTQYRSCNERDFVSSTYYKTVLDDSCLTT